jgi:hypothetical protein
VERPLYFDTAPVTHNFLKANYIARITKYRGLSTAAAKNAAFGRDDNVQGGTERHMDFKLTATIGARNKACISM